jgi:hypothetical protein
MSLPFPNVPNLPGVPSIPRSPSLTPDEITTLGVDAIVSSLWQATQAPPQWGIYDAKGKQIVNPDSVVDFSNRNEWQVSSYPVQQGTFATYNKVQVPFECMVRMTKGGASSSVTGPLGNLLGALATQSQALTQAQADITQINALTNGNILQGIIGGNSSDGAAARAAFLNQIAAIAASTNLFQILTPEWLYTNCNVTRYEVTRRGAAGAFFLDVDVYFIQVIQTTSQYAQTLTPVGTDLNLGPLPTLSFAQDPTAQPATNSGNVQPQSVGSQTQAAVNAISGG